MKLADALHCTGCGACREICPRNAISMQADPDGFPTPVISADQCVECGLCEKSCPALHAPATQAVQAAYAVQLKDRDALRESTSGGIFTALSREVFSRGGAVYGCVWDDEMNAVTRRAENEEEIKAMRGSKYVWSRASDCFPEIRQALASGRIILFTGLPCQVAGLKKYLGKEYDNLYLLDFLCSGSPSPLAFRKYLDTICRPGTAPKDLHLKFRDKDLYGVGVHITYTGKRKKTKAIGEHIANPYYYSFYTRLIDRQSCYQCPYGTDQRISDLTMGDYWGIGRYHQDMDIKAGVSALLVNTSKGAELIKSAEGQLELKPTKPEQIAAANNLSCNGAVRKVHRPEQREAFFEELRKNGWKSAERKYLLNLTRAKRYIKVRMPAGTAGRLKKLKKKLLGS